MRRTITTLATVTAGAALLAACRLPDSMPASGDMGADTSTVADAGTASLDQLTLAPESSMEGYDRDEKFGDWIQHPDYSHDHCDTREIVLYRQGTDVTRDSACEVTNGTWTSVYTGEPVVLADIEVDHMVPLAAAWRSGAADWSDKQRERFANDLQRPQLVAVDGSSNSSKSDSDPADWRPAVDECGYARDWITVKAHYQLTVDAAEHDALADMLTTCPA